MLHGELRTIREDNPILFKNVSLTSKLGFPDVIMPGDVRNDLYLMLDKGEFERGGKSTGKNIEVTVVVLDGKKNVVKVSFLLFNTIKLVLKCLFVVLELLVGCIGNWRSFRVQFYDNLPSQLSGLGRKYQIDTANW